MGSELFFALFVIGLAILAGAVCGVFSFLMLYLFYKHCVSMREKPVADMPVKKEETKEEEKK